MIFTLERTFVDLHIYMFDAAFRYYAGADWASHTTSCTASDSASVLAGNKGTALSSVLNLESGNNAVSFFYKW
jgi:hypothetical protein